MTKIASEPKTKGAGKQLSRRDFLRVGGAAAVVGTAGLVAGTQLLSSPRTEASTSSGVKYAMVIDLDRCFGCRACMEACKVENNTPEAAFWMYVFRFEEGHYPNVRVHYMPLPCMHCDNAPCVKVCPVGARYKRADGLTATDWKRCIGCRYCQVACPYGVNYFNWKDPKKRQYLDWEAKRAEEVQLVTNGSSPPYKNPDFDRPYGREKRRIAGNATIKGVMGKCTFCVHRLEKGLPPACVANCPVEVFSFGNLKDPESKVSRLIHSKTTWRLLEEVNTEPSVYYIGGTPPGADVRQIESVKGRI